MIQILAHLTNNYEIPEEPDFEVTAKVQSIKNGKLTAELWENLIMAKQNDNESDINKVRNEWRPMGD